MKKHRYILSVLLALCLVMPVVAQQTKTISGIVLDEKSEPVIGASVTVSGTKLATITDVNGKFSLKDFPLQQKYIQVSYIGYKAEKVLITDKKEMTIRLEPTNSELNEVVVVGYGVQKKAHMTGSISTLAAKDVTDMNTTNLATAIKGQINGISVSGGENRPGSAASITVRQSPATTAFSSVPGYVPETSPLYVIDDYISTETAFNNLDATMVESITVLKDASAAVYGARSAQGVILVKTKRGKEGAPKVSYSGQFGVVDEISRTKMLGAYDYGKIWNAVRAADKSDTWNTRTDLFQADELAVMKNLNYDLLNREWRTGFTQKHSVNISGGSDKANYFAGVSYNTQDGNIGKLDYNRWNYRAGVDAKIGSSLKASLQVSGDYGNKSNAYSNVGGSNGDNDYEYLLTHPRYMPDNISGYDLALCGVTNNEKLNTSQLYNFKTIQNLDNFSRDMSQNMTLNSSIEYDFGWSKLLKGLKVKVSYSKSIGTNKNNSYGTNYNLYKMTKRSGSGNHLFIEDNLDSLRKNISSITVTNGNMLSRTMDRTDNYQANLVVTYARSFGKHDISGLFTIERAEYENEYLFGSKSNPYSFTNYQSNGTDNGTENTVFTRSESGSLSYVGRLNYAYANKYLLEILVRSDASTKFAPENYWGTFPSVSAGWVISEEPWFQQKVEGIDFLKFRGSFGLLGKDNIKAWQWLTTYDLGQDKGALLGTNSFSTATGSHIGVPDGAANRNAHWDKSYQSNLGIDFNTFKNKLSVNLDGYYNWNRDVFMTRQGSSTYPSTVGAQASAENYGSIDTYGIELSIGWKENITKDLKYWVKINTGYSDNKVLVAPWPSLITFDDNHPNQRVDVGSWGYECIGMFHTNQEIEEYFDKYQIKSYMGMTKDNVRPGMLIYNNIQGTQKADGSYYGPNDPNDPKAGYVDENDKVLISNRSNPW